MVRTELRSTIAGAKRLGYYQWECEARRAPGEVEIKHNSAAARAQLTALASEARSHGLELLARKAERTLAGGV